MDIAYSGLLASLLAVEVAPHPSGSSCEPGRHHNKARVNIENRLAELGLSLPAAMTLPEGVELPFPWVRVHGDRAFASGHGSLESDGSLARPLGRVAT